ncbi:MAG: hypothetical protein JWN78_2648 [Bacteroidota bacterium]|nr:hypothetical protein [Bacteroidota bacterium]
MYNKIKRILALTMILVMAIPALNAKNISRADDPRVKYPKKTAEERAKTLTDTLSSIISLSSDQYQKAYASNLKYVNAKETAKSTGGENVKAEMLAAIKTRKLEIAAILTADQKAKWMTWKKSRKAQMQSNREENQKSPQSNGTAPAIPMDDIDGM